MSTGLEDDCKLSYNNGVCSHRGENEIYRTTTITNHNATIIWPMFDVLSVATIALQNDYIDPLRWTRLVKHIKMKNTKQYLVF